MIDHRAWMAAVVICCGFANYEARAESPAPDPVAPEALVRKLTSDGHAQRELALAELVAEGARAIPALAQAAVAKDPELSWRATEALQVICQSVDLEGETGVRSALVKLGRSDDKAQAAVAQKVLRQWPALRHHYAASQLELLGAEIAEFPLEQLPPGHGGGGFMPAGGAVFGGIAPVDFDGDVVIEEVGAAEDAVEDVAARKLPLIGGLLKALRRAAGEIQAAEEAVGEAAAEALVEGVEAEIERVEAAAEAEADVEFIEEAVPAPAMDARFAMEGLAIMDMPGGMFIGGKPMLWHGAVPAADPSASDELQPGTLRIGKGWRGGDRGLEYVAALQNVHTIILREAPLSDAALAQLRRLRSLSQLRVIDTPLSGAALLKFRRERPQTNISAVGPAAIGVAGVDHQQGFLVQQVTPETGARRAGLDENDLIIKVNGLAVRGLGDVTLALYDRRPGDKIKVEYVRQGKRQAVEVVLSPREAAAPAAPAHAYPVPMHFPARMMMEGFMLPDFPVP